METDLKKFDIAKAEVAKYIEVCSNLQISTDLDLGTAKLTLKQASEAKKLIDNKREELVKPHLDAQRSINDYAKGLILPLETAINVGKSTILIYEQEKETLRLQALKKIEEEKRVREESERNERHRIESLKNKLNLFASKSIEAIQKTQTIAEIEQVECGIKMYSVSEGSFHEFAQEALIIKQQLLSGASDQRMFIIGKEEQRKEALKLEGVAREQSNVKAAQEAESRRLIEEKNRIEREKKDLADRIESGKKRIADEDAKKIRDLDESNKLKELEAQKSKNIRKNWVFEIMDEKSIPTEFLRPDEEKIKQAIHAGNRNIPGIIIFEKQTIVIR